MRGHHIFKGIIMAAVLLALGTSQVPAQGDDGPLVSRMSAYVVTKADDGSETFVEATEAKPGDMIEYRLHYENIGTTALDGLAIIGPVPENTIYMGDTAASTTTSSLMVTIDGGVTWESEPVMRPTPDANGNMIMVPVGPEEYSGLKWAHDTALDAGKTAQYSYRVMVE